ncbi:mitochondrial import inner membrane translocase subunit Tim10 B [Phaenicophaeus curvirostris]|uniref:mitochondrial import inner membrane translocase subunit Tim10 B n=1 Tax=Phaenicophaeus curvirostris TaxID=33595 RepID=UPI0037F0A7DD
MDPGSDQQQQLRSLRGFLLAYNQLSQLCFQRCVCSLGHRLLSASEERCLDHCAGKLLHANHRLMGAYVGLMPALLERRRAEATAAATDSTDPPNPQPETPGATT